MTIALIFIGPVRRSLKASEIAALNVSSFTTEKTPLQHRKINLKKISQKILHKNLHPNDLTVRDTLFSTKKIPGVSPRNDRYIFSPLNYAATARRLLAIACGGFLSWLDQ